MKRMRRFNPFLQAVITYFIQHDPPWNECDVSTRSYRLWSLTSYNTAHHETNATFQPVPTGCDHLLQTIRPTMKRMDVSTRSYRLWSLTSNNTAHHETNATFQPVSAGCDHLLHTTRPTMKRMRRFNPFLQAVITYFKQHGPPWNEWTFQPVPTGCDYLLHTTRPTMKRMRRFNPFLQAVITYFKQHGPPWNEWTFQPVPTGCDHLLQTTRPTMKRMLRFNPFLQAVITYFNQHGPPWNECDVSTRSYRLWSLTSYNTAHHETNATFQPVPTGCDHLLHTTRPTMKRMLRFNPFLQAVITYFKHYGPPWNECYVSTRSCRLWSLTSNNTAHHESSSGIQAAPICNHILSHASIWVKSRCPLIP